VSARIHRGFAAYFVFRKKRIRVSAGLKPSPDTRPKGKDKSNRRSFDSLRPPRRTAGAQDDNFVVMRGLTRRLGVIFARAMARETGDCGREDLSRLGRVLCFSSKGGGVPSLTTGASVFRPRCGLAA
jgi:hypothetical protein